jgi:hypothetical protein
MVVVRDRFAARGLLVCARVCRDGGRACGWGRAQTIAASMQSVLAACKRAASTGRGMLAQTNASGILCAIHRKWMAVPRGHGPAHGARPFKLSKSVDSNTLERRVRVLLPLASLPTIFVNTVHRQCRRQKWNPSRQRLDGAKASPAAASCYIAPSRGPARGTGPQNSL